jgi:hypothetical protein
MIEPERIELISISNSLVVTIEEVGEWLNLGSEGSSFQSSLLTNLIRSSQRVVENYLWYDLNLKSYIAYYEVDEIDDDFLIPKAPIFLGSDITKIEYLSVDNVWTEIEKGTAIVDNQIYDNINIKKDRRGYTRITLKNTYEINDEEGIYNFRISFNTGYEVISGTGDFTVTIANPAVVTLASHGLKTGDRVTITTTGVLPTGLIDNGTYYVIYVTENTFCLAITLENALISVKVVTSGTQSGVHSLTSQTDSVPEDIKTALKEIVEYNYINRGENKGIVIPESAKAKIDFYSIAKTVIC